MSSGPLKPGGGGPPGSSGSSSDSDEDEGDGGGGGSPFRVDTPHAVSVGIGSGLLQWNEKEIYRSKDLSLIKLDQLPTWRNSMLAKVASIDQMGSDVVLGWLLESFNGGKELGDFSNSGILPRLDTHLGALMMDPKHLKGELGMRFQTYAESCQNAGRAPRIVEAISRSRPCSIFSSRVIRSGISRSLLRELSMF